MALGGLQHPPYQVNFHLLNGPPDALRVSMMVSALLPPSQASETCCKDSPVYFGVPADVCDTGTGQFSETDLRGDHMAPCSSYNINTVDHYISGRRPQVGATVAGITLSIICTWLQQGFSQSSSFSSLPKFPSRVTC